MNAQLDANIWAVMGASGTGKGLWIKSELRKLKPRRLIVWDYMREYGEFAPLTPKLATIAKRMEAAGADGALKLAYHPVATSEKALKKEFETLCELVYAWGGNTFLAEELSGVTTPSWAPAAWRKMSTSGRHQGIHIIGVAQFPALIDKAFLGNCTKTHVSQLHEEPHRRAMERSLDVVRGSLDGLRPFQFVEKDRKSGVITTGVIVPPGMPKPPRPSVPTARSEIRYLAGRVIPR